MHVLYVSLHLLLSHRPQSDFIQHTHTHIHTHTHSLLASFHLCTLLSKCFELQIGQYYCNYPPIRETDDDWRCQREAGNLCIYVCVCVCVCVCVQSGVDGVTTCIYGNTGVACCLPLSSAERQVFKHISLSLSLLHTHTHTHTLLCLFVCSLVCVWTCVPCFCSVLVSHHSFWDWV